MKKNMFLVICCFILTACNAGVINTVVYDKAHQMCLNNDGIKIIYAYSFIDDADVKCQNGAYFENFMKTK